MVAASAVPETSSGETMWAGTDGTGAFPEGLFTIEGDAGAVRESARPYESFSRVAATAESVLTATTVASWQGSEGELFRSRRDEFVPMMTTATRAFLRFAQVINTFAEEFDGLISRMKALNARARVVFAQLQAARAAAQAAADGVSAAQATAVVMGAAGTAIVAAAEDAYGAARSRVSALESQWEECCADARRLHQQVTSLTQQTSASIGALPGPEKVPSVAAGGATATTAAVGAPDGSTDLAGAILDGQAEAYPTFTPEQATNAVTWMTSKAKDFFWGDEGEDGRGGNIFRDGWGFLIDAGKVNQYATQTAAGRVPSAESEATKNEGLDDSRQRAARVGTNFSETIKGGYEVGVAAAMADEASQANLGDPEGAEAKLAEAMKHLDRAGQHFSGGTLAYVADVASLVPVGGGALKAAAAMEKLLPAALRGELTRTALHEGATIGRDATPTLLERVQASGSAREAADIALSEGVPGGATAELHAGGKVYVDISTGGAKRLRHPDVAEALARVPKKLRQQWFGNCAELGTLSQALEEGTPVAGGRSIAIAIGASRPAHGAPKKACLTCSYVLDQFGVDH